MTRDTKPRLKKSFNLLRKIWLGLHVAGALIWMTLTLILLILKDPPPAFRQWLIGQAVIQTKTWTGLPLSIAKISEIRLTPVNQILEIENLRLMEAPRSQTVFLEIPRVRLELNLMAYLLQKPVLNRLSISTPHFWLKRNAQGQLTFKPQLKKTEPKPKEPEGKRPYLPQIALEIQETRIDYQDQSQRYPLSTRFRLPQLSARIMDQNYLTSTGHLRSSLSDLDLSARLQLWSGQTHVQARLRTPDLAPIAAYGARVKDLTILTGQLDSALKASWQDYHFKDLRYEGHLQVQHLKARLPLYQVPWDISTQLQFNQTQLNIQHLELKSPGHHLELQGTVNNYQKPAQLKIATAVQLHHMSLEKMSAALLHPAGNNLRALRPSGDLKAEFQVQGTPANLRVSGHASLPEGRIRNIAVKHVATRFNYGGQQLDIPTFSAQAFAGVIQAQAKLMLNQTGMLTAKTTLTALSLQTLKQALGLKLPADYNPEGQISLQAAVSGSVKHPQASGLLSSSALYFPSSRKIDRLKNLTLQFDYSPRLTRANLRTWLADTGQLKLALKLKSQQDLELWLQGSDLPVKMLNPWLPGRWIQTGQTDLQANLSGSLTDLKKDAQNFNADLDLNAQNLALQHPTQSSPQHLKQLKARLHWRQGHAHLDQFQLSTAHSHLSGQGSVALKRLASQDWSQALQGVLQGRLAVRDFPFLKNYQIAAGDSDVELTLRGKPARDVEVTLKSQGKNFEIQQVHLDQWGLQARLAQRQLHLTHAHLQQGTDRLILTGTADLQTADPQLKLRAYSDTFQLQNMLSLLPPALKAQLENSAKKTTIPPADANPPLYTLPQVRERMLFRPDPNRPESATALTPSELAIPLGELMENHWKKWSYLPDPNNHQVERPEQADKKPLLDDLKGRLSIDLELTGSLRQPELHARTLLRDLEIQGTQITEAWLEAQYADRNLHLSPSWIQAKNGSLLRAEGDIHLDRDIQLEIQGEGINLKTADPLLNPQTRLEGQLDFFAVATGSLRQPEVSAQLTIHDLLMNQLFFDRLESLSGYRNGYLEDLRVELNYGDQQIVVFGNFPIRDLNQPVELTLSLKDESFGLINLFTGALDWRQGKGAVLVKLVGTPRKPELEGTFRLDKASVYLPALKELMSDIDVKGQVFTKTVQMDYLKGKLAGGNLEVKGSMDLLNLLPSFLNLEARGENLAIRYTMPGLLNTETTVKEAALKIKGLISQPVITGKVTLGKNGETTFPFLKERDDFPTSSEITDESGKVKPPRFLFGGLNVEIPFEYGLHSPIFDIPVSAEKGINLRHRGGRLTMTGDISAKKGTLYLFNNALNIDRLSVSFPKLQTLVGQEQSLNPDLKIETSFNVKGAEQSVKALITGKLEDLKSNQMRFEFSNKQGLTDTQILNQILGGEAVAGLSQGDIAGVAAKFSDVFLRGLFNPLTSRLSEVLGLEELSLGIVGQSVSGPVFSFNIRSNPFFLVEDLIEARVKQLSFLNKLRISGQGTLSEQAIYKLGGNYSINENWALDYQFKSNEQLHNVTVKGSYSLPMVLDWLRSWRKRFQSELKPPVTP